MVASRKRRARTGLAAKPIQQALGSILGPGRKIPATITPRKAPRPSCSALAMNTVYRPAARAMTTSENTRPVCGLSRKKLRSAILVSGVLALSELYKKRT